jgi:hypothetical protein
MGGGGVAWDNMGFCYHIDSAKEMLGKLKKHQAKHWEISSKVATLVTFLITQ